MIELKFTGSAEQVRAELRILLGDGGGIAGRSAEQIITGAVIGGDAAEGKPVGDTGADAEPASTKGRRGRPPKVTDAVVAEPKTIIEPEPASAAVDEKQPELAAAVLTLDDVRNAASGYIKRFGMDAAQVDLMSCLKAAAGVEKISELTGKDQATLEKAVKAFTAAAEAETRYGQIA